ncbi:polysaccharide pyruvyl transferase [Bacillus sp. AFS002410]|uniref:polysaccharide pyruvyl transferase family protein n=1 Tax=Bacillus sp. AFS002410 TaxID=2033481 RepID=UPI000BF0FDFB|nr:polysaccharide pyruvyl transferase family protein [Bacillus sp. AFS002410]PEJ59487.1 polysaccharide pyruvyl transferase [Bacillus sp. AFS002410]
MSTTSKKKNSLSYSEYIKFNTKFYLKNFILNSSKEGKTQYGKYKGKKKFFVMQTPTHGNLGDQAIAYAQKRFIEDNFKGYEYIEVPFEDVIKDTKEIKKVLEGDDVIGIHGGGNMGDLYLSEEYLRRYIIKTFKGTKIVSFPQTISFSDTSIGKRELKKSISIYNKNPMLLIVARETQSYNAMKKYFGEEKVVLTPDIVLSLNESSDMKREGILTCFRNDKEKVINHSHKEMLLESLKKHFGKVTVSDTSVPKKIYPNQRKEELSQIWDSFRSSELVITDRLHGMIFAVITNTPCIVFKNSNHKIECTFLDWLQNKDNVQFLKVNEIEDKNEIIKRAELLIHKNNSQSINENPFKDKYKLINSYIQRKVTGVKNERV